jgi:hypothetical protein
LGLGYTPLKGKRARFDNAAIRDARLLGEAADGKKPDPEEMHCSLERGDAGHWIVGPPVD